MPRISASAQNNGSCAGKRICLELIKTMICLLIIHNIHSSKKVACAPVVLEQKHVIMQRFCPVSIISELAYSY